MKNLNLQGKVIAIADMAIANMYQVPCDLLIQVPNQKTKENYESILEKLFLASCDRQTTLVAIGGGTICDLVGYVAATFMRGLPLILIPTTLLAIVDASIGGKTAIDTPFGKNLIGSTYFPKMVIADLDVLATLPNSEWINGMAEILKMGLIQDRSIWDQEFSDELVEKAIQAKIKIVETDPEERGIRRILNFGHTIGHGIEKINDMAHGRAVALGSLAEAHLSMSLGFLPVSDFQSILVRYQNLDLRLPENYSRARLFEMMRHDKKKKEGLLRFVLIDQIGRALPFQGEYCYPVFEKQLEGTLLWLEQLYM